MNITAIIVTAIVLFIIGMLWYSPLLFGKIFMQINKVSKTDEKRMKKRMPIALVFESISLLVAVYVLATIFDLAQVITVQEGMMTAAMIWLGFVATTLFSGYNWEGRPFKWWMLHASGVLVQFLVAGIILATWL